MHDIVQRFRAFLMLSTIVNVHVIISYYPKRFKLLLLYEAMKLTTPGYSKYNAYRCSFKLFMASSTMALRFETARKPAYQNVSVVISDIWVHIIYICYRWIRMFSMKLLANMHIFRTCIDNKSLTCVLNFNEIQNLSTSYFLIYK